MKKLVSLLIALAMLLTIASVAIADELPPVYFASSISVSGSWAESGVGAYEGTQYAIDRLNDRGGLKLNDGYHKVILLTADDGSSPEGAVANVERFITRDNVKIILNQLSSGCTLAIMELAKKYPDVYIQGGRSVSSTICEKVRSDPEGYKHFFKCEYNSEDLGINIAACISDFATEGKIPFASKKVAFICEDSDYGRSTMDGAKAGLEAIGCTSVAYEVVPEGAVDFYAALNKIQQSGAELVVCNVLAVSSGVAYVKQFRELGLTATSFCIEFPEEPGFYDQAGIACDKLLWGMMRSDFNNNPKHIEFKKSYEEYYPGKECNYDHMHTYDMTNVLVEAIERVGELDVDKISEEMLKTDYDGYIGHINFNPEDHSLISGPNDYALNMAQIQNGRSICVWPATVALAEYIPQQ